jgi:hypothetical protein
MTPRRIAELAAPLTVDELVKTAFRIARDHGFWDVQRALRMAELPEMAIPEKLALIHSEVSEALEDYRLVGEDEIALRTVTLREDGKPLGFAQELGDIVIRVADLCGRLGIDLEDVLLVKMAYNDKRPCMHGKVC